MNILLIINSDNNIFEIDSGGALRNNLFVRALSEVGYVDIICFSRNGIVSNIPNCDVLYSKRMLDSKDLKETVRLLVGMIISPSNPYSYYHVNEQKASIVSGFLEKKDYDIVACRYVETAIICGLLKYKEKLVIDLDDNQANVLRFEAIQEQSKMKKWKKMFESQRISRMLNYLCNNVRCSFCSNPTEMPSPQTVFLHNTTFFEPSAVNTPKYTKPRILFVGFLNFFPNKHGITHFVENIFPHIKCEIPQVELKIVGDATPTFLAFLNGHEGVIAVGRVADLVTEYQQASIVIIPMYYGSGTCVKFVEALLMSCPVVSTPVGARGFSGICKDGEDYMLAKDDNDFRNKILDLLSNKSKAYEIAKRGSEIAGKFFSKDRFIEIVKEGIL